MEIETPFVSTYDRETCLRVHAVPLRREQAFDGAVLMVEDITERKKVEKSLRESEEKFRIAAENAGVGISVIQDDEIVYVNETAAEMSGFSRDEMQSLGIQDLIASIDEADRDSVREYYRGLMDNLDSQAKQRFKDTPIEYRHIRRDGTIVWIQARASAIYYREKPALAAIHNDITDRKTSSTWSRLSST